MTDLENNTNPTTNNTEITNPDFVQDNNLNIDSLEGNQTPQDNPSPEDPNLIPKPETNNNEIFLGKFENAMISTPEEPKDGASLDNTLESQPTNLENSSAEDTNAEDPQKSKLAQKEKLLQLIKVHESKAQKSGFIKGILSGIVLTIGIVALSAIFAKDQIINLLNGDNSETPSTVENVTDQTENNDEEMASDDILEEDAEIDENLLENDENSNEESEVNEEDNESNYEYNENNDEENYEYDINSENDNQTAEDEEHFSANYDEEIDGIEENSNEESEVNEQDNEINYEYNENNDENYDYYYTFSQDENIIPEENEENVYYEENEDTPTEEYEEDYISPEYYAVLNNNNKGYTITHVDSEEEANWVLPTHCDDLSCYGEDKEFTPCSTFRLAENIGENVNRIGNNGTCRYKDSSELVYVEFD